MHPTIYAFSLISLISLSLGGLTGCGEKRIHVSTLSGAPGEEMAMVSSIDDTTSSNTSGLLDASVDESSLSGQVSALEEDMMESEFNDLAPETGGLSGEDESSDVSLNDSQEGAQEGAAALSGSMGSGQESGQTDNDGLLDSLQEGQGIHTQSISSSAEDFQDSVSAQPEDSILVPLSQGSFSDAAHNFSGEDVEPVMEVFQIAKVDPTAGLQDQLKRMKEEFTNAVALEDVFFQFDSWTLTEEGRQSLQRTFGWFEQESASNLIIEGHADQRGTQAYNMVLAKKRAVAVQEYLAQLGVNASRLAIISYGKDKPFCQDSTEVCHQLNRRGHLFALIP